jgi:hypothetical protein
MSRALAIGGGAAAVAAALALPAAAEPPATAAASGPKVTAMVAGRDGVLRGPRAVRAAKRRVKVGGRRCAVPAGTPLAALAALRVRFRLRDYGACGRRARDAGGLFVFRVGPDRNRGSDGWVYKVGRRAGTGGAADPAGPFGTGRKLRRGDRLLWFWCEMQRSGGCQRTLEAVPDRTAAAPGETIAVTVHGYDDAGRGVAVEGATVRLGSAQAVTAADGVARVPVPPAGRHELTATAPGAVPAFPGEVRSR